MAEQEQHIVMWQGDSKDINFTPTISSSLNDSVIEWALSLSRDNNALVEKTLADGISFVGDVITVELDPVDTVNLKPGRYYHELKITDGVGKVVTTSVGRVWLKAAIIK